jgi:acetyl-CoA C-acetyltransferase
VAEVILGCVTQAGDQAGNIAKTSTLYAGWPTRINGVTINRFCSSSTDAIAAAALKIAAGQESAIIAGGVEMMSRVPMLSDKATVFIEPEFAAQCQMLMMGNGADLLATLCGVSRTQADTVALHSQLRAEKARAQGFFKSIIPIFNPVKNVSIESDECIRTDVSSASLAQLPAAFAAAGLAGIDALQLEAYPYLAHIEHIHTAGNSPAMADAAAVVLVGDSALGKQLGMSARARIVDTASVSEDPLQVVSGCVGATKKLMHRHKLTADQVDLFEIHEAFAATIVKCHNELDIPSDKLNVNGGVIALGHPMGATGAIMLGTLLDELERRGQSRGIVATSGAAGAGSAVLVERL